MTIILLAWLNITPFGKCNNYTERAWAQAVWSTISYCGSFLNIYNCKNVKDHNKRSNLKKKLLLEILKKWRHASVTLSILYHALMYYAECTNVTQSPITPFLLLAWRHSSMTTLPLVLSVQLNCNGYCCTNIFNDHFDHIMSPLLWRYNSIQSVPFWDFTLFT